MANDGDRDWMFEVQDFITYCVSNERHVLHLFNVEPAALLPILKGSIRILFSVLIHYGVPDCVGLAGDAVSEPIDSQLDS